MPSPPASASSSSALSKEAKKNIKSLIAYCFTEHERPYKVTTHRVKLDLDTDLGEACVELEKSFPGYSVRLFVIKDVAAEHVALGRQFELFLNDPPRQDWKKFVDLTNIEDIRFRDRYSSLKPVYFAGVLESQTRQAPGKLEEDKETSDIVVDLPSRTVQNFHETVKAYRKRPSPSVAATSAGYEKEQATERTGIYDGRVKLNGPARSAPPIELYYPGFGEFLDALHSTEPIPDDLLRLTAKLMRKLSVVRHAETDRDRDVQTVLNDLLGISLARVSNRDGSTADASNFCEVPAANQTGCRVIVEWKTEMGSGGSDPLVQASFSYIKACVSPEREKVLDACPCPCFIISIAGSWLSISGAVFTSHPIVQRLTGYQWLGRSRVMDSRQVFEIARIFHAIRKPLEKLQDYYNHLVIPSILRDNCVHPRFFPHITSYTDEGNRTVKFAYVRSLQSSVTCVAFEAELLETKETMVVKYVDQYSASAHRYMAGKHMAPALRYFGPLDPRSKYTYAGLSMVVMDKVNGKTLHDLYDGSPIPPDVIGEVEAAVSTLKAGGFVHGDLRAPNVMLLNSPVSGTRVRLIDFDWAGEVNKVRYPFDLTSAVKVPAGEEELDYQLVTHEHMEKMMNAMLT